MNSLAFSHYTYSTAAETGASLDSPSHTKDTQGLSANISQNLYSNLAKCCKYQSYNIATDGNLISSHVVKSHPSSVFIGQLPVNLTRDKLIGILRSCNLQPDAITKIWHTDKGSCCLATFNDQDDHKRACDLNRRILLDIEGYWINTKGDFLTEMEMSKLAHLQNNNPLRIKNYLLRNPITFKTSQPKPLQLPLPRSYAASNGISNLGNPNTSSPSPSYLVTVSIHPQLMNIPFCAFYHYPSPVNEVNNETSSPSFQSTQTTKKYQMSSLAKAFLERPVENPSSSSSKKVTF